MSRAGGSGGVAGRAGSPAALPGRQVKKLPSFTGVGFKRIRPFSNVTRYGHAVGRIRVMEMRMLNSQRLERLIDADFEGALNILDEIDMGDYLASAKLSRDVDADLTDFLRHVYSSLAEALPRDSVIMDFFLCRYDFHNLKALLKARLGEEEPQGLLEGLGALGLEALRMGVENPALLPSPYLEAMEEAAEQDSPQEVDTLLEKHFLAYRLQLAEREDSPFIIDFARSSIDLANLKLVIRARLLSKEREFLERMMVRGGFVAAANLADLYSDPPEMMAKKLEANPYFSRLMEFAESEEAVVRLTDFDRRSDDQLMEMVQGMKRVSVGVEPIFAYLRARENEVLMVRLILISKLHKISPEAIEKALRKLYIE